MHPRTTRSKLYPKFIRENDSLNEVAKGQRIWPKIGLENCQEKIDKKRKIVFSGSGTRALWDIATMSMRGISSCQSWRASHRQQLIGSMADPYCGIIYITTGTKTTKGERMTKRALVRFVINHDERSAPALLLERVYPADEYGDGCWNSFTLFRDFLVRKSGLIVISAGHLDNRARYSIPLTDAVIKIGEANRSYRDSRVQYIEHYKYKNVNQVRV